MLAWYIVGGTCIAIVVVELIFGVFRWVYNVFIGPALFGSSIKFQEYGKWALITGATDGIGKAYARALAKRGLNIILVSRSITKLEAVAEEIRNTFKVETLVIDVDFTSGLEIYDKIKKSVAGLEIGILVNNVGMFYNEMEFFLDLPDLENLLDKMVKCNIVSVPMMCSIILPQMVARRNGLIINISSLSSKVVAPMMTIYSASKSFVDKFSTDLSIEYGHIKGLTIQSLTPGVVATNMTKIKEGSIMAPTAEQFVNSALKTVGITATANGYFFHAFFQIADEFVKFLSPSVCNKLTLIAMKDTKKKQASQEASLFYLVENHTTV